MRVIALSAFALGAVATLALVAPALAGVAGDAHVSGQYHVVYVKVAGQAPAGAGLERIWSVKPSCEAGGCSLRISSRAVGQKAGYPLPFNFDGTTYQNVGRFKKDEDCVRPDGSILVSGAYDSTVLSRFRVTRMSASGRALTFKGTYSERYTVNAAGRAGGCGAYYTDTERYTGYAITTP